MYKEPHNIVLLLLSVFALAIGVYALFKAKKMHKSLRFLAWFMITVALENIQMWFIHTKPVGVFPEIVIFFLPLEMISTPLFFLFIVYYLGKESNYKWLRRLVFIPFAIFTIIYFWIKAELIFVESNSLSPRILNFEFFKIEEYTAILFSFAVGLLSFFVITRFERENAHLSHKKVVAQTRWIKQILLIALGLCLLWAVTYGYDNLGKYRIGTNAYLPAWFGFSFLVIWIGYSGFYQSKVLKERKAIQHYLATTSFGKITQNRNIHEDTVDKGASTQAYFDVLENTMREDKIYLNPSLNLVVLAERLQISPTYLSKIINTHSSVHLSEYINTYRIESAKQMLLSKDFQKYTILSIALEAGFNSKSAFYATFKKIVGQTPSEFKTSQNR